MQLPISTVLMKLSLSESLAALQASVLLVRLASDCTSEPRQLGRCDVPCHNHSEREVQTGARDPRRPLSGQQLPEASTWPSRVQPRVIGTCNYVSRTTVQAVVTLSLSQLFGLYQDSPPDSVAAEQGPALSDQSDSSAFAVTVSKARAILPHFNVTVTVS